MEMYGELNKLDLFGEFAQNTQLFGQNDQNWQESEKRQGEKSKNNTDFIMSIHFTE